MTDAVTTLTLVGMVQSGRRVTPRDGNHRGHGHQPKELMSMSNDTTKTCTKCGVEKLPSEFRRKSASPDGLQSWCRVCASRERAAYYAANREKAAAYQVAWHAANREKATASRRKWRVDNPEKAAAIRRKWLAGHLEEQAAHRRNYRALKKGNGGSHTAADIKALYDLQEGQCWYCFMDVGNAYHVDHYMPISRGGSNGPENLVIACGPCNLSKNDSHPDDFQRRSAVTYLTQKTD